MPAVRPPLVRVENSIALLAMAGIVILPLAEIVLRKWFATGIPGAAPFAQHLTMWVGMLGAAIAARDGKLLSLATGELLAHSKTAHVAKFIAAIAGAAVATVFAVGGVNLVQLDRVDATEIAAGVPVWVADLVLPIAFGLIALRLMWGAAESRVGRAIAVVGPRRHAALLLRFSLPCYYAILPAMIPEIVPLDQLLAERARSLTRKTFIKFEGKKYSFGEMDRLASVFAAFLLSQGMRRGDRVALLSCNCHEYIASYFGIIRAGGCVLPVNNLLTHEEVDFILQDAGVSLVFYDAECSGTVSRLRERDGRKFFSLGETAARSGGLLPDFPRSRVDDVSTILYTSGTTGRPKGALLTHRNIISNALAATASAAAPRGACSAPLARRTSCRARRRPSPPCSSSRAWGSLTSRPASPGRRPAR